MSRSHPANVLGVDLFVASAEDVVLAKLRWRLTSLSHVQWRDYVEIAATNDLDLVYLAGWASRLEIECDLAEFLLRLEKTLNSSSDLRRRVSP